jgi:hypothetical protein
MADDDLREAELSPQILDPALDQSLTFAGGKELKVARLVAEAAGVREIFDHPGADETAEEGELGAKLLVSVSRDGPFLHVPPATVHF